MWRSSVLSRSERSWVLFLFMPYALSFVAFFAPMWQRYVPEGAGAYIFPENNPVYLLLALVMNVMRVVALWIFVNSRLFVLPDVTGNSADDDGRALNRCVFAVMLAAFFIINGLALVYKNVHLFSCL